MVIGIGNVGREKKGKIKAKVGFRAISKLYHIASLKCPALLLTLVAAASTQQILQKLHSKDKIFQTVHT